MPFSRLRKGAFCIFLNPRLNGKPGVVHLYWQLMACGDCLLTIAQSSSLSGFVAYFEGNISTKIGLKICACIEKLNTGVVKIDLLA